MPLEGADEGAGGRVPQLQRLVVAAREHAGAVGRERNRSDRTGMPLEGADERAGGRVPQLRRLVLAAREHAVRRRPRTQPTRPSSECPSKVRMSAPVAASHSFSVLSTLPDSTRAPSGENATEATQSECPSKVRMSSPVAASQSFNVLSPLPESTCFPSGENATEHTASECPRIVTIASSCAVTSRVMVRLRTRFNKCSVRCDCGDFIMACCPLSKALARIRLSQHCSPTSFLVFKLTIRGSMSASGTKRTNSMGRYEVSPDSKWT